MVAQDGRGPAVPHADQHGFAERLGAELGGILEQGLVLAQLQAERARRAFVRKAIGLGLLAAAGMVLATISLVAGWQFAHGVSQGLAAITGRVWLGDLLGGALLLVLCFGGAALVLRRQKPGSASDRGTLEGREHEALEKLKHSATGLGEELVQSSHLREHVREHPYLSLGAALAAGAAAAPLVQGVLRGLAPLALSAVKAVPGILPIPPRAHGPTRPMNGAPPGPGRAPDP